MSEYETMRYLRRERDWEVRVRVQNQQARSSFWNMFSSTLVIGGAIWAVILWWWLR